MTGQKNIFAFTASILAYAINLHPIYSHTSDSESEIEVLQNRICALEQKIDENCGIRAFAYSPEKIGTGLFLTGEWLYWRASEKGLTYAIMGDHDNPLDPVPQQILSNGKSLHPDFKYHSGYRIGAGWVMPHDHWDIYCTYTRYHVLNRDSANIGAQAPDLANILIPPPPGQYIAPFWIAKLFINNLPAPVNSANAAWKLHIDLIDALLGKEFCISKWFTLRPFFGMRTGWINQKYNLHFTRLQAPFEPSNIAHKWDLDMKNDFWGIGVKAGLDANWCMGYGFSIFGDAAISLLNGFFDTRFKQTAQGFDVDEILSSNDFFENKNNLHTNVLIADLGIGLEWSKSFCNDRFLFAIWGGYEQHIFFEQNQFMNYQYDFTLLQIIELLNSLASDPGPNYFIDGGNLTTSGFTGGIKLSF